MPSQKPPRTAATTSSSARSSPPTRRASPSSRRAAGARSESIAAMAGWRASGRTSSSSSACSATRRGRPGSRPTLRRSLGRGRHVHARNPHRASARPRRSAWLSLRRPARDDPDVTRVPARSAGGRLGPIGDDRDAGADAASRPGRVQGPPLDTENRDDGRVRRDRGVSGGADRVWHPRPNRGTADHGAHGRPRPDLDRPRRRSGLQGARHLVSHDVRGAVHLPANRLPVRVRLRDHLEHRLAAVLRAARGRGYEPELPLLQLRDADDGRLRRSHCRDQPRAIHRDRRGADRSDLSGDGGRHDRRWVGQPPPPGLIFPESGNTEHVTDTHRTLRVALAQVNTTVGDIEGNARLAAEWIARARDAGAQLVVLPEQTITGYPAEDLWLKPHFLSASRRALEGLASDVEGIIALVGYPEHEGATYNSVAVIADGSVQARYRKMLLPNYSVFDEDRYFEPGDGPALIEVNGARLGVTICEDIWYPGPPASIEALAGAGLIVNPSASPYHRGKGIERERMIRDRARETGAAFAVCNLVGGQDELVFD